MLERVYEDDELVAFWRRGSTPYVLVTFGDAITLASGDRFFADLPAAKADITCLGIMTHGENWYPVRPMRRLAEAVAHLLARHEVRIGYGGSMGGYGAIKFSRLFRTTHTIALCPQWSIDRGECDGHDPGFQHWFKPGMTGHHVRPDEVGGRIVLCFDPDDPIDRFHATRLSAIIPSSLDVHMPMVGHHVTTAVAGTANLLELIATVQDADPSRLRAAIARLRRRSPERAHNVLRKASARHPRLAARAARLPAATAPSRVGSASASQLPLLAALLRRDHHEAAADLLQEITAGPAPMEDICAASLLVATHRAARDRTRVRLIRTIHDSVVVYDMLAGRLSHLSGTHHAGNDTVLPVHLHVDERRCGQFFIDLERDRFWLRLTPEGRVQIAPPRPGAGDGPSFGSEIRIDALTETQVTLQGRQGFLCATPGGWVTMDRATADTWESFTLHPVTSHWSAALEPAAFEPAFRAQPVVTMPHASA